MQIARVESPTLVLTSPPDAEVVNSSWFAWDFPGFSIETLMFWGLPKFWVYQDGRFILEVTFMPAKV